MDNIPGLDTFNDIQSDLLTRMLIFIAVVVVFTLIIDVLKLDNHFYGLNSETGTMETVYFVCLSFSGMGYGGIYAQTAVSRLIMVILSVIKFILIIDTFALVTRDSGVQQNIDNEVKKKLKDLNLDVMVDNLKGQSELLHNLDGPNSILTLHKDIKEVKKIFGEAGEKTFIKTLLKDEPDADTLKTNLGWQISENNYQQISDKIIQQIKRLQDIYKKFLKLELGTKLEALDTTLDNISKSR